MAYGTGGDGVGHLTTSGGGGLGLGSVFGLIRGFGGAYPNFGPPGSPQSPHSPQSPQSPQSPHSPQSPNSPSPPSPPSPPPCLACWGKEIFIYLPKDIKIKSKSIKHGGGTNDGEGDFDILCDPPKEDPANRHYNVYHCSWWQCEHFDPPKTCEEKVENCPIFSFEVSKPGEDAKTISNKSFPENHSFPKPIEVCCDKERVVQWFFRINPYCEGSYTSHLHLTMNGGHLGENQINRMIERAHWNRELNPKPEPDRPFRKPDDFVMSSKGPDLKCGTYNVWPDLDMDLFGFPVKLEDAPQQVTITEYSDVDVHFHGTVELGEGGGDPPPKGGQGEMPGGEGGGSDEYVEDVYPGDDWDSSSDEEKESEEESGVTSDLDRFTDLDRYGTGGRRQNVPGGASSMMGPPWTQLDIIVDPHGTIDTQRPIFLHQIEGPNMVRGLFDGNFRGFVEGNSDIDDSETGLHR